MRQEQLASKVGFRWGRLLGGLALLAVLALWVTPQSAGAAEIGDPETFRGYDVGDGRLSLDVEKAPFGQVVRERIQPRTTINLVVSPEAEALEVSVRLVDVHWVFVLDILVNRIGGVVVRKA